MKIKKLLTQRIILNFLFVICIVILMLNNILLLNKEKVLFSFLIEFRNILSNLSLAFISSYIFYYVVVVIKDKKDKKNINLTVYGLTKNLIGRAYSVFNEIITASGTNNETYNKHTITREQFQNLCNKANPKDIHKNVKVDFNNQFATYGELILNNSVRNVNALIDKIFNYMPFLDTEFVHILNKIENSIFFMNAYLLLKTNNTDFSVYAKEMYDYLEFVRELENYNETINRKLLK